MRNPSSFRLRVPAVLLVVLSFCGLTSLLRADRMNVPTDVSARYSPNFLSAAPGDAHGAVHAPVINGVVSQPAKPSETKAQPGAQPGSDSAPAPANVSNASGNAAASPAANASSVPAAAPQSATSPIPSPRALVTEKVDESNLVALPHSVHPLARAEFDQGPAPSNLPMNRMLLVLNRTSEQEAALDQLLTDQQNPNSANFKKWLTPDEFGKSFGPADSDIQAVTGWLGSRGFQVASVSHGKTVIEFSGTAAQVQDAFHTQIHKFTVKGQDHWANTSNPRIPAALAPVIKGFASLHNFVKHPTNHIGGIAARPRPLDKLERMISGNRVTGSFAQNPGATAPGAPQSNPIMGGPPSKIGPNFEDGSGGHGLGPTDFATIYNVAPLWAAGIDGTGQTIAIVGRTDLSVSDVNTFRALFGLSVNPPQVILNGPDPGNVPGEDVEAQLDAEWSGAVAKGATIKFVISEITSTTDGVDLSALYIVDNNLAPVMSASFGGCELNEGSDNQFFSAVWQQAAAQGITAMVSSGDEGSAICDDGSGFPAAQFGLAVNGVASTPYNVAVGGTSFDTTLPTSATYSSTFWNTTNAPGTLASAKSYIPERTWSDSCALNGLTACASGPGTYDVVAGGGGPSTCATQTAEGACIAGYPKPVWQTGTGVPADGVRDLPDVSLFADFLSPNSYYFVCDTIATGSASCSSFEEVGGTSASSPSFAGIMALVNAYQASISANARQGNANYILYPLAAVSGNSCNSSLSATITNAACVFYDITKGNNSVICYGGTPNCSATTAGTYGVEVEPTSSTTEAWPTTTGYDYANGLGSVNAFNLAHQWSSVALAGTSTTLTLNGGAGPINITHGTSVTVAGKVTGTGTPTGQVGLISDAASGSGITDFALTSGTYGAATTLFPGGSYTVTAHYNGDGANGASTSTPAITLAVSPENSTTQFTIVDFTTETFLSGNPTIPYGSNYYIRVDVGNSSGHLCQFDPLPLYSGPTAGVGCPTGTINPFNNLVAEGSYPLNSQGFAEAQNVLINAGVNSLTANYTGDSSYNSSVGAMTLTIQQATTTAQSGATSTSITAGNSDTLAATITTTVSSNFSKSPTGNVQFFVNGTAFGAPVSVIGGSSGGNSGASASLVTSTLPTGTDNVTVQYLGDVNYKASAVSGATVVTVAAGAINLTVSSSHNGTFSQGQNGAFYTLTVTNTGASPTTGTVTVVDTLPASLTATAMSGSGWTCTVATATCTSTAVVTNGSFPPITLTVNVSATAPASVTNIVNVSGGGEGGSSAPGMDMTTITASAAGPNMSITVNTIPPDATFTVGQNGIFVSTVTNNGTVATTVGGVTVTATLPSSLTFVSAGGGEIVLGVQPGKPQSKTPIRPLLHPPGNGLAASLLRW